MNQSVLIAGSTIVAVFMATLMIFIRAKVARRPTSIVKIILPPIFMSSGAFMFVFPVFRLTMLEALGFLGFGVILSFFLILTTKFEVKDGSIYLIPSKAFILILVCLMLIRTSIKLIIGATVSFWETSSVFFLLAFGMIISWRVAMLIKYLRLKNKYDNKKHTLGQN